MVDVVSSRRTLVARGHARHVAAAFLMLADRRVFAAGVDVVVLDHAASRLQLCHWCVVSLTAHQQVANDLALTAVPVLLQDRGRAATVHLAISVAAVRGELSSATRHHVKTLERAFKRQSTSGACVR